MKKLLFLLIIFILPLSLMGGAVASANSAQPSPSDNGRGIIFEKYDKVKIVKEVLDIDFYSPKAATVTAKYHMKNITSESLSVNNMFLYPLYNDMAKEIKVMRNGLMIDYDVECYGEIDSSLPIIMNNDWEDWEKILSENTFNSKPFGDGSGFIEYTFNSIDEGFSFVPDDYYFAENFYLTSGGYEPLTAYGSKGKIITRQNLELDGHEYTTVEIDNIYNYLKDYYKNKGYYDLLATTLSKSALYNIKSEEEIAEFDFLFSNSLEEEITIDSNLDWSRLSQTFEDGSGFFEYTLYDIEDAFPFEANDYYFTKNFTCEKIDGYDALFYSQ